MAFSVSASKQFNLLERMRLRKIVRTPLDIGAWALLAPAGQQNHAPQLCWITPDELACVWMAGGQEGTSGMSIYGCTLKKGSTQWGTPKLISQNPDRSEQNPLLFKTDDGRIHLVHTAQTARDPNDLSWQNSGSTFSMQWTAKLFHQSTAAWGKKWSQSKELFPENAFCRHPPIQTNKANWLLPIYRSLETEGAFGHDNSLVLQLDAQGVPTTGNPIAVPQSKGRVHGSIVYSSDGHSLIQFFRSRLADRIYRSVGNLDGTQWSEPTATDLPNNNSSIQALRLSCGLLLMIFNRFGIERDPAEARPWGQAVWPRNRWPLSIALSDDDGLSWPWVRDIDTGDGFFGSANWANNRQLAYPCVVEGLSNEIHLAYSWGGRAAIRYMCIDLRDIIGHWS